jgi:hypothetical protein
MIALALSGITAMPANGNINCRKFFDDNSVLAAG